MQLAQASGINGFVVDWNGINQMSDFPRVDSNFIQMLNLAEKEGFGLAIDYDAVKYYVGDKNFANSGLIHNQTDVLNAVHDDLAFAIRQFGESRSYMRYNGEPIIFVFGPYSLSPSEWEQVTGRLKSEGLNAYYLSMQADDLSLNSYYPQFQGFFPWIPAYAIMQREVTSVSYMADRGSALQKFNATHRINMGMGVWPGFDDSPVGGWCGQKGATKVSRMTGTLYNQTWEEALKFNPNFIHVVTFNDWNEGTIIEPSIQFGYQYLYATAYYSAQFKGLPQSYEGIPVPLAIYNATLTTRQAQHDGRTTGLDAATQMLTQAEQAFQSGNIQMLVVWRSRRQCSPYKQPYPLQRPVHRSAIRCRCLYRQYP
jgi:glycoprotein endo-alpha-1,2-mannosidase